MRRGTRCLAGVVALLALVAGGGRAVAGSPPERIVTLAPHLAELAWAAGAGEKLVGVSAHSDHPPAVEELPVVGDAFVVDQEQLALLAPDVILAWQSGTPAHVVDELRNRGYRVAVVRTRGLDDIRVALARIGELAGNEAAAGRAVREFDERIAALQQRWAGATPIRVFYQVSRRPVYTVNGDHYVSDLIGVCGGVNVFAELANLAPVVTEEAVLERDPEVLLAPGVPGEEDVFSNWQRWSTLAANRYGNHFLVPGDLAGRASPRLTEAGRSICEALQQGRERRQRGRDG